MSGAIAAGHFDHYVCRRYPQLRGREEHEVARLLHAGLLDAGIPEERITVTADPEQAVRQTLAMGQEGDLLVMTPNSKEKYAMWDQITGF